MSGSRQTYPSPWTRRSREALLLCPCASKTRWQPMCLQDKLCRAQHWGWAFRVTLGIAHPPSPTLGFCGSTTLREGAAILDRVSQAHPCDIRADSTKGRGSQGHKWQGAHLLAPCNETENLIRKKSFDLTCSSSNSFELRIYVRRIFSKPGLQDLQTHFLSEGTFQSTMEQRGCGVCDATSPFCTLLLALPASKPAKAADPMASVLSICVTRSVMAKDKIKTGT